MLELENLTKRYEDGKLALDQLSLKVKQNEIYVLLGANGAGKSTTINLICGFIKPTTGKISVNSVDAVKTSLKAKEHLAYVSENVNLYDNFSGFENLAFFAGLTDSNKDKKELENVLRDIGLQERFIHKPIKTYSKGMRQKVGIAIAIVKDAEIILLDEPFSGLDPKAASDFQKLLVNMRNNGKAIFMSTHNIFRAKELADKVGIMKDGELVLSRTKEDLELEDLEELYIDYMEGNLVNKESIKV